MKTHEPKPQTVNDSFPEGCDEVIKPDFGAQLVAAFYLEEPNVTYVRDRWVRQQEPLRIKPRG